MVRPHRQAPRQNRSEPDSLPAFLAWLGNQGWSSWIKITLFVVITITAIGLAGIAGSRLMSDIVGFAR
jgi:hypothetical protein